MEKRHDGDKRITVEVIGQEGDKELVEVNVKEHLRQLLHKGLKALYGDPAPDPGKFDLVFKGNILFDLGLTIGDAGINDRDEVSILPIEISRGCSLP